MNSFELMKRREEEIAELVLLLSKKSASFLQPKMVVIGGYAMRAFVPFSRYSRDCDFALASDLETVKAWKPQGVHVETSEQEKDHGFMRWSKGFGSGKRKAKLGVDFMAGQVRGREGEIFTIDEKFLSGAQETEIAIAGKKCKVFVPSYADFFVLKVMASRKSDIRDLAALVWKNGVPGRPRLSALNDEKIFYRNLKEKVIPEIEHPLFLDSWHGMFLTGEFADEDRKAVSKALKSLG